MTIETEITHNSIKLIKVTFTGPITSTEAGITSEVYDGKLLHLVTSPSAAKIPSANWDVTVVDVANGLTDILAGAGLNRSSGSTQHKLSSTLGAISGSKLRFIVANVSATGDGTIFLYLR